MMTCHGTCPGQTDGWLRSAVQDPPPCEQKIISLVYLQHGHTFLVACTGHASLGRRERTLNRGTSMKSDMKL